MDEIEFKQNVKIIRNKMTEVNSAATQECLTRMLEMMVFMSEQITELQEAHEDE